MEIKVAVIGPHDLVAAVKSLEKAFPTLTLLPFGYKHEQETMALVQQCIERVDVFLFAGPIPYQIAREQIDEQKPMIYLPYTGTSLYRVFFQLLRDKFSLLQKDRLRFSIDILRKEEIEERLDELEIAVDKMFVKEYHTGQKTDEIVKFHYDLWINQEVDAVLTSVTSVYKKLIDLQVPSYRIVPTKSTIHECLQRVDLEGKSLQLSETQLAIGIISVENISQDRISSEYEIQRKKLAVQQILIDYGEETQALLNWTDRNEITFVTTRGVIERTTHSFTDYPLLHQLVNELKLTASIGIGLGRTANEAEIKAREAVQKAKLNQGGSCYIVMQDGRLVGPLGQAYQLEYSLRSDDPERLQLAHQAGLSVGTINKLISYCQSYGGSKVTATELAIGFGIKIRSARRILSKLEHAQLANVVGEEQPVSKGRPRQIYHLTLA